MDEHTKSHLKESPWVVTLPLVMLAIPSVIAGWMYIEPMLFGDFFGSAIVVAPQHDVLGQLGTHWHGIGQFMAHGVMALPFWLAISGIIVAWVFYIKKPELPDTIARMFKPIHTLLVNKYYFDELYQFVFARGSRAVGGLLWKFGDVKLIDGLAVNGSARLVGWVSSVIRYVQTGYVYHYAFAMIIGLFAFITFYLGT